jgi:flavin reductase (DIM6/NTAB) family NADH-FMN oxidoreductase RutF
VNVPAQAQAPSFSPDEFRDALGMFATGVTIVTARAADGTLVGLTLWSLARSSGSMPALDTGSHYAINILAANQKELAERFAQKRLDRWVDVPFTEGLTGAPLLDGAVASFECFNRSRYDEGDHVIFVGEVEHCAWRAGASPLLFHGGRFFTEHPL